MANLMIKRADPEAAAEAMAEAIRADLPTAGVTTRTEGDPKEVSIAGAIGHELGSWFRDRERTIFMVRADVGGPRLVRLHAGYVPVARGAGPFGIVYETRLGIVVPGGATFQRGVQGLAAMAVTCY